MLVQVAVRAGHVPWAVVLVWPLHDVPVPAADVEAHHAQPKGAKAASSSKQAMWAPSGSPFAVVVAPDSDTVVNMEAGLGVA